jgi:antitoxin component YwqK of YwqJK toxin-antitoxin module
LVLPGLCLADTLTLKDGTKIEGEVTGEMDGAVLLKTKYGSLTVNKADIQEQKASTPVAQPAQAAAVPPPAAAQPEVPVSTQPAAPVKLTFATVLPSSTTRLLVYSEGGVTIATETYDAGGALLSTDGAIKDGTYTEYYDNGTLKTVKTMASGKAGGTLKAFYPSGAVQIEAYYLAGARDGAFKYYSENGKPLMEASYKADKLNGWKREYDAAGALKSETYYADDRPADPPKPAAAAPEQPKEQDSMVAVKITPLARGDRFTFQLNGKYIGKMTLDKDFNLISFEGDLPDGAAKAYSKEGKLQKEFVFEKNALKLLRVYEDGGPLKGEYTFKDDQAVKK